MGKESTEEGLLKQAYDSLKNIDLPVAGQLLDRALGENYEHGEIRYALKCVHWWKVAAEKASFLGKPYERGNFYLEQWPLFQDFLEKQTEHWEPCRYAIQQYVFSTAKEYFTAVQAGEASEYQPQLYISLGRCNKWIGNYEQAIKNLEMALQLNREDPACLAELGDVNALINDVRLAKALFREAFFLNPQAVDLRQLESDMIQLLIKELQALGYKSPLLEEWIPIYATLWQVFNVKRELRPIEVGKLKQSIINLENELKSNIEKKAILTPRLLNKYFWLIDHYVTIDEDKQRVKELLMKIHLLDENVHTLYTGIESVQ